MSALAGCINIAKERIAITLNALLKHSVCSYCVLRALKVEIKRWYSLTPKVRPSLLLFRLNNYFYLLFVFLIVLNLHSCRPAVPFLPFSLLSSFFVLSARSPFDRSYVLL